MLGRKEKAAGSPRGTADTARLLRQQEALLQVIEEISSELELRPLLTRIVEHACKLLGADDGAIGLYDRQRDVIRTEAAYRMPPDEVGTEVRAGVGLAGLVLERGEPVVLARYGDAPQPPRRELAENAVIGVPIQWRGKLVGFFGLGARPPRRFDTEDVETLSLFARHAAIAIDNARRYTQERARTERLALLASVGRTIASGLALDEMLVKAADAIHKLLGFPNVAVPLLDEGEAGELAVLELRAVAGFYRHLLQGGVFRMPVSQGLMGVAVRERRTILVNDVENDPHYIPTPGSQGIRAELAVPILLRDEVLGVVNVESGEPFTRDDAQSLEIAADHLAVGIKNARLFADARQLATLEERQRLARDLHDSVTQTLASATMIAESVAPALKRDPEEGERRLERLIELNRAALVEMRSLLNELRPAAPPEPYSSQEIPLSPIQRLAREGLVPTLTALLDDLEARGFSVQRRLGGYRKEPPEREEILLRLAQESLHNVVKHAEASEIQVGLETTADGSVRLGVVDDGRGFEARQELSKKAAAPPEDGGLGVLGMRERVREAGGDFQLESHPGLGTRILIRLPKQDLPSTEKTVVLDVRTRGQQE